MNKTDLVSLIAEMAETTKTEATTMLDIVLRSITQALRQKGSVRLVGFGTFTKAHRAAVEGRNPKTGAKMLIPAMNQVKFKPGKGLKDSMQ